ncbi:cobalamin biosynthesis protein [Jatrophihabitans sp.]|uniref:cobalamin biosynthesis protein n=1 Tax=Jatrophihabitans sp. TaxID=1932789 RepID=UPI002B5F3DF1|nr:cobalamin biosynthesis protein [Jatrophihabitans sp.]
MSRLPVAAGLVLGVLADELLGDPRRGHPVAGFGMAAAALERRLYRDTREAGQRYTAACVLPVVVGAALIEHRTRRRPIRRTLVIAAGTWTVIGGRSLRRIATDLAAALYRQDTGTARTLIPSLCGRDPESLDNAGLARATVESVAENTADSVTAPLFWGAVAGLPGLLGYRAVNTLDAMVGHRSPRYARFGTAAARLDDLANLIPSRLTAALTVALARQVGGSPVRTLRTWWSDAAAHPSPNAGQCEAAAAGALGLTLGGETSYPSHTEHRPLLGTGRTPEPADIGRATRLSHLLQYATLGVLLAGMHLVHKAREATRNAAG